MSRTPKPDFERYMTALRCEEPDRVPLGDWHVDQRPKEAFMGRKLVTIQDLVDFWHTAGFDYVTASSGILEPVRAPEGMTTRGEAVHTEYGDRVSREWAHEHEGVITSWAQFEKYRWPSVDDFDLSKWDVLDRILPKGMKAILLLGKIYTPVWMYMGAEVFFNALETNPELVEAIFQKVGQIQYETFLRVVEHPCVGAVLHPDDIAHNTGLLVHPRHLRRYLFPWYRKMSDVCKERGIGHVFHSDGDCTEAMDDLIACGFDGFHPIQPNAMDIVEVKRRWGRKLCLIGNLNLDSTLTLGTPEDVRAEVYERIRTIGPGGGYMVSSSNSVTDYVPLANMKAMFDATFEFGKYPIQLEAGRVTGKVWTYQGKGPLKAAAAAPVDLDVDAYVAALLSAKVERVVELFKKDMEAGVAPGDVVGKGMIPAMTVVGEKFQSGQIYIPEMMIAAKTMGATLAHFKDVLVSRGAQKKGKVVIGTVKGDLHDIGKNLVGMMLEGQGFEVTDLGVSVGPEKFVQAVQDQRPDVLAMSALLTTTMIEMKNVVAALQAAGLRKQVKVMVGGAPVTQKFADQVGADGYAYDAPGAAQKCKELLAIP
jgi:corrinoid protein of di/trimethylamine methyltransferase